MVQLRPFRALRPPPDKVARVASVPYDVVNSEEARALAAGNPLSLLHVSRPEIDLPESTDIHADAVYAKGAENLARLIRDCPLETDEAESLFVYRQTMGSHVQTGVVGCCAVDDYDSGVVKRHERTRQDKEDDRTRHIVTLRAQTGPVFLTYRPDPAIDRAVAAVVSSPPVYDFAAPDEIRHTMWRVESSARLTELFRALPFSYIADGHHRAASASRARRQLGGNGPSESDWFLAVLFPADQLRILPYHRVVKDLHGSSPAQLLAAAAQAIGAPVEPWEAAPGTDPQPDRPGLARMYLDGRWYSLCLTPRPGAKATERLDVSILMDRLLAPLLGIGDPRTDKRIDFVGGIRGTRELVRLVEGGHAAVAFAMFPTTVDELMAVADSGEMMPPKSTWFEPKLRSGLVIHRI